MILFSTGILCILLASLFGISAVRLDQKREERASKEREQAEDAQQLAQALESAKGELVKLEARCDALRIIASEAQELRASNETLKSDLRKTQQALGEATQAHNKLVAMTVTADKETALRDFLNRVVQDGIAAAALKVPNGTLQEGRHWAKIYLINSDKSMLTAAYASDSAPADVISFHVRVGCGGVGKLAAWIFGSGSHPQGSRRQPRYYPQGQLRQGLNAAELDQLERTGVRSVLATAIFPHVRVAVGTQLHLSESVKSGARQSECIGFLCFCSTLPPDRTCLDSEPSRRLCEETAAIVGRLLAEILADGLGADAVDRQEPRP